MEERNLKEILKQYKDQNRLLIVNLKDGLKYFGYVVEVNKFGFTLKNDKDPSQLIDIKGDSVVAILSSPTGEKDDRN